MSAALSLSINNGKNKIHIILRYPHSVWEKNPEVKMSAG